MLRIFCLNVSQIKATSLAGSATASIDCDYNAGGASDCADGLTAKCKAWKAFSVLGNLATIIAGISGGVLFMLSKKDSGPQREHMLFSTVAHACKPE